MPNQSKELQNVTSDYYLPNIELPIVRISAVWPGASPRSVERYVTAPIERALQEVQGRFFNQPSMAPPRRSTQRRHGVYRLTELLGIFLDSAIAPKPANKMVTGAAGQTGGNGASGVEFGRDLRRRQRRRPVYLQVGGLVG